MEACSLDGAGLTAPPSQENENFLKKFISQLIKTNRNSEKSNDDPIEKIDMSQSGTEMLSQDVSNEFTTNEKEDLATETFETGPLDSEIVKSKSDDIDRGTP
jgi:hypothetical protein